MPACLPQGAPASFDDLLQLSPPVLRTQLQKLIEQKQYRALTDVQATAISFMLEYRDLLCIAPTASGKTLCYVFAAMLRLLLGEQHDGRGDPSAPSAVMRGDAEAPAVNLNRPQVERLLEHQIKKGEVCPYCELDVRKNPICSMTGSPHPPPPPASSSSPTAAQMELTTVAAPRVLVLVPTSQLAFQVSTVFRALHCDCRIRHLVRASSAEEQKKYLKALEAGVDVLVSSPETILPALYKHKLSLQQVQTLILDEVDDLISVNHFEPLKIILGALPRGPLRPQRILLGASLPPVGYEMIKRKMLLPSHRFVLADLPHVASASSIDAATPSVAGVTSGFHTARANLKHIVFLLGRVEKINKLAWLYTTGKLTADQRTIIFCNSRHNVAYVHDQLRVLVPDVQFATLSSRASATAREGVLRMFSSGVATCLICTDLLSRGIDLQNVVYVVNYDMPTDLDTWIHRCGRCARGVDQRIGYVYTFFQPENVKLAKPLVAYLRQQRQLVPPKLQEYARQSFIDVFNNSLFHHPTRPYRQSDPQNSNPVMGRGTRRYPDYKQEAVHQHFRPQ